MSWPTGVVERVPWRAFLWDNGTMTDLGGLADFRTWPRRINDRGQIMCISATATGYGERAFLWEDGKISELPNFGGPGAFALDMNRRGQVVGVGDTALGDVHGFIWEDGVALDLGRSGDGWGDFFRGPFRINDRGQVAGTDGFFGYLWDKGVISYIDLLPDTRAADISDLNNRGQVTGRMVGFRTPAFVWERGVTTELAGPTNFETSPRPVAINNRGEVVGYSFNSLPRAVLWRPAEAREMR